MRISLKVRAGARLTGFTGRYGDAWKLNVAAPPVDGKANEAIVRFLSSIFSVPHAGVRIIAGHSSTTKLVEIVGVDADSAERAILGSNALRPRH